MEKATKTQLKRVRELLRNKRARDDAHLFVAEGVKIVGDIVAKGHALDSVFVSRCFADNNESFLTEISDRQVPAFEVGDDEFDKVSSLQHAQGVLAVVKKPAEVKKIPVKDKGAFIVLCDGIQDPGNLGTIIRASAAFNADAVILTGDPVDMYNPKVVRASSGMLLDIPVLQCKAEELDSFKQEGYQLLASQIAGEGSKSLTEIKDLPERLIVAFGSEGRGLSAAVTDMADGYFHIPISEGVESLNVTAAVSITLYFFTSIRGKA